MSVCSLIRSSLQYTSLRSALRTIFSPNLDVQGVPHPASLSHNRPLPFVMRAHLLQMEIVWEDKAANHRLVREMLETTDFSRGDLVVLPELFDVGFTLNTDIAIDHDDSTLSFLQSLADDTRCIIHGSRALRSPVPDHAINCATITAPGQTPPICEYAKVHPFSYGRESESYTGGDDITQYTWTGQSGTLTIMPSVCYDLRFPELYRRGVKTNADAFVLGANWPAPRTGHWRTLAIARAIENQSFVMGVNRTGSDPHLDYSGNSIVVDPQGEILGELSDEATVLSVEIDAQRVRDWRQTFPALNDMKMI